jgi:hypothetical protein
MHTPSHKRTITAVSNQHTQEHARTAGVLGPFDIPTTTTNSLQAAYVAPDTLLIYITEGSTTQHLA